MFLNLLCEVSIGNYITRSINQGEVKSSWKELTDTCSLTLPRNLVFANKNVTDLIKVGDPVTVRMSVNDKWNTEFEGYIREIDSSIPLKITCEDEMWKLKQVRVTPKSWPQAEVKDIISHIIPASIETKVFTSLTDSVTIGKYMVNNMSAAQVLANLREYGIFSYFRNKVLHVGFAYDYTFDKHIIHFQKNMIKNDLKYRKKGDYKIQVKAIANLPTGQKTIVYVPDEQGAPEGSELRTLNFGELTSDVTKRKKLLTQYAEAEIKRFNVDGYRGRVTLWGIHNVKHGDELVLRDSLYPERESTNLVDEVVTSWGEVYFKRECEVGPKVSAS